MPAPIRLTQEEYNRLMSIEHYARELNKFIADTVDFKRKAHADDGDSLKYSRALYCHIALEAHLNKGAT